MELNFEPVNGSIEQAIATLYGVAEPINGSWMQAICERFGVVC